MSNLPQWVQWRGPTAPPPPMRPIDPTTLTLWREHMLNVYALAELTGVPTLYRWGRALWERRPIHEVEREYFERIFRQLQQLGAAPRLEVQPQLRGAVPIDYIAEGRRAPPVQVSISAPDMPEDARRRLQAMGVPTSPHDVAEQVAGRSVVLSLTALPGLAGMTREAAKQLAKIAAAGFGVGGTGAAATRVAQGFPEEAPRAFVEVGLASTVATDIASALRALAASVSAPQLRAAARQVLLRRQQQADLTWRDPEGEAFVREVEDAVLRLKRGDASKYDALVRQFEEWQKKVEEFSRLYEARQRGQLSPEDETRYTKLLKEVAEVRDKYDLLKQYIETARELGLEAGARRAELERRTIEDLARAAQAAPPGPPPRDVTEWLQKANLGFLQRLVRDQSLLSRYARRFGVDEQTLAERAALVLRERQWERLAEMQSEELKRILMDEQLLKRYATEFNVAEDKLRALIEDVLQKRLGVKPTEPQPVPERPPIEPIRRPETQPKPPETQFRPPETEGFVATREGQILIVGPKEEGRVAVARAEELPDVQTRLRALLRRRLQAGPVARGVKDVETADVQTPRARETTRLSEEQAPRVADEQAPRVRDEQVGAMRAAEAAEAQRVAEEVLVLDRDTLHTLASALPAQVFAMPAPQALAYISRVVGLPVALAPGVPRPSPRESFGAWLDRVFAGTGFTWRSLVAQKETFVFA